ncbi:DUF3168 domain-containing protein [Sphingomonas jatrophae]|uniref:DUF3168 domain-containing protein n=1 Tax=Sphingomonas jatrophae TaxID=1166337 RepID=A0A1I6L3H1_9SPHN|nr:DUF3168 domain-containing protein [Sphingomonas jatrophae]SFR98033.1 Protein of unknown function [Sphingomonas jatrophae]
MSAVAAVQAAMVAALRGDATVAATASGVFDGPPARAAFPYVAIGETLARDWSAKGMTGRELNLAVIAWDEGGRAARLHALAAAAEAAIEGMARELDGWRIVSLVFVRSRVVRDPRGPWAAIIEFRARAVAG